MRIENVILQNHSASARFAIEQSQKGDTKIVPMAESSHGEGPPSLVLPALCHPHIHLDKAYLLTSHSSQDFGKNRHNQNDHPNYSDLTLESGSFSEALQKTSKAKERYTVPDLLLRGSQLVAESIRFGVTSMRAFVEIDHVTEFKCLEAAIELKQKFAHICYIQICAFAQDPIMSTEHGVRNRELIEQALADPKYAEHVQVLGTTPYVEGTHQAGITNIKWAIETALKNSLHLDFHLDYNVDEEQDAMVFDVVRLLKELKWNDVTESKKRITVGHCTRMSLFSKAEMQTLRSAASDLPIAFVGLPTSDLFMMGRVDEQADCKGKRQRGTLQILDLIKEYDWEACIGVNNVGNPFTPWGDGDPLKLASLGVGLYQSGTADDAKLLFECVSTRARIAIGLETSGLRSEDIKPGSLKNSEYFPRYLIIDNEIDIAVRGLDLGVPARQRLTVVDVVWDPPNSRLRRVLYNNDH